MNSSIVNYGHLIGHLSEEFNDSLSLLCFITDIMNRFQEQINANMHIGQAELRTMKTSQGKDLRKIVIMLIASIKDSLTVNISKLHNVTNLIKIKTESLQSSLTMVNYYTKKITYEQQIFEDQKNSIRQNLQNFIAKKEKILKNQYISGLHQYYGYKNTKPGGNQDDGTYLQTAQINLRNLQNQHFELKNKIGEATQKNNLIKAKIKDILAESSRQATNFDGIYKQLGLLSKFNYKYSDNKNQQIVEDQQEQEYSEQILIQS